MHFSSVVFGTVLLQTASNFGWIWRGTACCTCDDTNVGEVRFAVQLGKTLELVFLVKWVRYQGARGFGWARWRRHRCSTSAVIWTVSPRCSHRAGLSRDRKVTQNSPEYTSLKGKMGAFQILSETWAKFEVQLWKASELVFLVKWVMYQGARGFGWARWRRHRCSTSAVIWTASPRCSHGAGPYFMVFPCFSHQGKGKTWYMDSVQSTGWLQVKSA